MTAGEVIFAQLIDGLLLHLHPLYYKSLMMEALYAFARFCKENPTVSFKGTLHFAKVLEVTAKRFRQSCKTAQSELRDLDLFLTQSPSIVHRYLQESFSALAKGESAA